MDISSFLFRLPGKLSSLTEYSPIIPIGVYVVKGTRKKIRREAVSSRRLGRCGQFMLANRSTALVNLAMVRSGSPCPGRPGRSA